jgi:hypothetical protein
MLALADHEISRFPGKECAHMPVSKTTPGRLGARVIAPTRRRQPPDPAALNHRDRLNPLSLAARHDQRSYLGDRRDCMTAGSPPPRHQIA